MGKNINSKILLILYIVATSANIVGNLIDSPELRLYSKPLLMPLLIAFVYERTRGFVTLPILIICAALIFSWGGDLALMQSGPNYFLLGLSLFLIAHIAYAYSFIKSTYNQKVKIRW